MNSYVIESIDTISLNNEINKIIKKEKFEDAEISTYDIEETLLENALEDLDTYNFLSPKKVIIIKNLESIKQEENKKDIEHLLKYLDNKQEDKLLIIASKKLNGTYSYVKTLKKKCENITPEVNTKAFIKKQFEGYDISQATINLLDEYCSEDITKIYSETEKLKMYKVEEKKITEEDIKELVLKKQGDAKEITFAFVRALGEKNIKKTLELYRILKNQNIDDFGIIGLIASQIRIIYQVKILENKRMRDKEIADILGEKEFRIKKTRELTSAYSEEELLRLMQKLSDIDLKIKTSDVSSKDLMEIFIINLEQK